MNRIPCRAAVLAVLLLAAPAVRRLSAETVFGGTAGFSLGCMIDPAAPLSSILDGALEFAPVLRVEDPLWKLELGSALRWETGAREAMPALDRLSLAFSPADFLTVRIGRFAYLPGAGGISSCTDWFAAFDFAALVTGDTAEPFRAGDMIQAGFSLGDFSLVATAMPFAPSWSLPDPSSPWFPGNDIPKTIHYTWPTVQDVRLKGIVVKEAAAAAIAIEDVGVGLEIGASLPWLDLSLLAYHGWDNTALYRPSISQLWSDYTVTLTPVTRKIDSVGLDATWTWSSLTAWVDGSYTFSKSFLSKRLSVADFAPFVVTAPYLEYAAGAGWQPGTPNLILQGDYRGYLATGADSGTVMPFLASHLDAAAVLRLWEEKISIAAQAILSTKDWSGVVVGSLTFTPSNEFEANLAFPFFFGASDAELGQFAANFHVSLRATARF